MPPLQRRSGVGKWRAAVGQKTLEKEGKTGQSKVVGRQSVSAPTRLRQRQPAAWQLREQVGFPLSFLAYLQAINSRLTEGHLQLSESDRVQVQLRLSKCLGKRHVIPN